MLPSPSLKKELMPSALSTLPCCSLRSSGCTFSFTSTESTDPASQTAPGKLLDPSGASCGNSLTATAPWGPAFGSAYGLNCTNQSDTTLGPAQIYTDYEGLALVPSDSCVPNWGDTFLASNNPAARVTLVPTNTSRATYLRSMYVYYYASYSQSIDSEVTFRLTSSLGQVIHASSDAQAADWGYGPIELPEVLVIPAGGNATVELLNGTASNSFVSRAPLFPASASCSA